MFDDTQFNITYIDEACLAIRKIIDNDKFGFFHAASSDITTPYDIMSYLLEKTRGKKEVVKKSSFDKFIKTVDNPMRYIKFGGLKVKKTEKELGIKYSSSRKIIDKMIEQGLA